jgi:cytoskeleton protein RodZ
LPDSLGEQLLKARLAREETLEQVSRKIHVRQRYLEALENGEPASLPSRVQGKGFLRLYAGYLNLPVGPLLDLWEGRPTEPQKPVSLPQVQLTPQPPKSTFQEPASQELFSGEETTAGGDADPVIEPFEPSIEPTPAGSASLVDSPPLSNNAPELLEQIGETLRRQRELLGLTLADVERHTHVRLHYLKAIESGRLEDLPSSVQGRGMISNVAVFLGLDPDKLLNTFADALQARRRSAAVPIPTLGGKARRKPAQVQTASAWRRLITPDLLIGGALFIALFLFVIITASRISAIQANQIIPTLPPISEVLLQSQTPHQQTTPTPTVPASVATRMAGENPPVPGNSDTTLEPAPTITLPVGISGAVQVIVVARQRTYLRVTVDGKSAFDGRVLPGNAYPFGAEKRVEILTGSAAALQIFFNQTDLGSLGQVGQVKNLIFTKDGMVTPTPLFSPSPTRTETATATYRPSPTLPTSTITPYIP